jgi:hypothetical protein
MPRASALIVRRDEVFIRHSSARSAEGPTIPWPSTGCAEGLSAEFLRRHLVVEFVPDRAFAIIETEEEFLHPGHAVGVRAMSPASCRRLFCGDDDERTESWPP